MSAGDLVTSHYHLELRGLLMGPGTRYGWGPAGWSGLGLPPVKTQDVTLDQDHGDYPGRDYLTSRVLTFPIEWGGSGPADVMLDLAELNEAWAPATAEVVELHMALPGWEHFMVRGRPRGLTEDLSRLKSGEGAALLTFVALDPTIVFVGDLDS